MSIVVLRMLLAAWIGAAVLFVITSVAEQTSDNFGSLVRDQLATIRFPLYYFFGFCIHGACLVLSLVAALTLPQQWRRRFVIVHVFVLLATIGIVLDYQLVYQPLQVLISPPGQVRTPEFIRLHNLSRNTNQAHLALMFIAAIIAARPMACSETISNTSE